MSLSFCAYITAAGRQTDRLNVVIEREREREREI